MPSSFWLVLRLLIPAGASAACLLAASLPSGFTETSITGLSNPTAMAFAPDGRLFVCQQGGQLRVIKNGILLATPFVTLPVDPNGERGLLGIAFDPNFATNQFLYLYYTATSPATHNRVSRFTASGDFAVSGSEVPILDLPNLSSATNHNGGAMHFGPDGKLYIAVGENANGTNAQSFTTTLGKLLRLNADGSFPSDNPFFSSTSGINRSIWALGLRNPFTFAFQPGTGRMFINDVGQNTWEEINDGIAGSNYGWPNTEGVTSDPAYRSPLFIYGHGSTSTTGCAITGGTFYNPATPNFPSQYTGKFFFADYCTGWIRTFDPVAGTASDFASGIGAPVDLQVGADGALYYLSRGSGAVFKVISTSSQAPQITQQPQDRTVTAGQTASFSVTVSGSTPLTYQWQRNGVNISGATAATYSTGVTTTADNGAAFRVIVTNSAGNVTSNPAFLTVTANQAPTATITAPAAGTTYAGGDVIAYSGNATDPEDGTLPASAFTWQVDFYHDTHTHPFLPATSGNKTGSITIPTAGETSDNVFYRITLTVRDSGGLTTATYRDVVPRKSAVTLQTSPSGLQLTLDGQPVTSPYTFTGVAGIVRALGAPSPQTVNGVTYQFVSWSDNGASTHNISTPAANTTYTATFQAAPPGGAVPIRINAGGGAYTAAGGVTWAADSGFSGGAVFSTSQPIGNTTDAALYQVERYGYAPFTYAFNVPAGSYQVTLKFAEISAAETVGSRRFHVDVNGTRLLTSFDVLAAAGGLYKAVDRTFPVTASAGQIQILFTAVASSSIISAIEIVPASAASPVRINAGGGAYTDTQGASWSADTGFNGGSVWSTTHAIANTSDAPLYQVERYSYSPLVYTLPVANGTYDVKLKFAEISDSESTNTRRFHVDVNAARVLSDFDVYTAAGGSYRAVDRTFRSTVTGGQIVVTLTPVSSSVTINAIEITPASSFTPIRVNAGGGAYTDSGGLLWTSDTGYNGGLTFSTTSTIAGSDQPLFQAERYSYSPLTYSFAAPNGTYTVRLRFAEISSAEGTGTRRFHVDLNGARVLTEFDVFTAAGGLYRPVDRSFQVSVTNGQLSILFTPGVSSVVISAIEITAP